MHLLITPEKTRMEWALKYINHWCRTGTNNANGRQWLFKTCVCLKKMVMSIRIQHCSISSNFFYEETLIGFRGLVLQTTKTFSKQYLTQHGEFLPHPPLHLRPHPCQFGSHTRLSLCTSAFTPFLI